MLLKGLPRVLELALGYIEMGYPVLPLEPGGKRPHDVLGGHGFPAASTNRVVVSSWFKERPDANIGIVPPLGAAVLDFDNQDWLRPFFLRYPSLEEAPRSRTPRGYHVWVAIPHGVELRTRPSQYLPQFEVKKPWKGYTVEAPSSVGGLYYVWEVPLRPPEKLPPMPGRLLSALTVEASDWPTVGFVNQERLEGILSWLDEEAHEGNRHVALRTALILFRKFEAPPEYAARARALALERGLPESEVEGINRWVEENVKPGGESDERVIA